MTDISLYTINLISRSIIIPHEPTEENQASDARFYSGPKTLKEDSRQNAVTRRKRQNTKERQIK